MPIHITAEAIQSHLATLANPTKAAHLQRFFKTGPGEYGEGDVFRGIRVPALRKTARQWRALPLHEILILLQSPYHEDRFVALCILVQLYQAGEEDTVYQTYLRYSNRVNSWDLVDTSVHKIVGQYLLTRPRSPLYDLAQSSNLWERRMAIISTYRFIQNNQFTDTLALSELLINDTHDLMHKAVGWMLREVGKRDQQLLITFLDEHYQDMPRTMLRYAIERFDQTQRKAYLRGTVEPFGERVHTWQAYRAVMEAERRLKNHTITTPLLQSISLSQDATADVWLKLENQQHTGSFKYRGALNKLLDLSGDIRTIVTASTGNHGLAVAKAMTALNHKGTIYLPETADAYKVTALRTYGVKLVFAGQDGVEAEQAARDDAEKHNHTFVSPYNDWAVLGGQGTIGLEILSQIDPIDYVFASVGGGGLIAGVASVLKAHKPSVQIIGCSPERSPVMHESIRANRIVDLPIQPTLSDGTAGGIEPNTITFPLCQALVDEWITVSESEIAAGMRRIFQEHNIMIEGAAGVVVASFLKMQTELAGKHVVLILCGGNIEAEHFKTIIHKPLFSEHCCTPADSASKPGP